MAPATARQASRPALAADEAVRAEIAAPGEAPRGRLRMTFVQTPAPALLPGVLERLAAGAPELQVEVVQRETTPAPDDLRSRAVDLVVGIEYDPVPVPRLRDVDRVDLLREDVLLTLHPRHPALTKRGPVRIAALEHAAWAAGARTSGGALDALVASGRAVALLPALLTAALPQITARRVREERLQRSIFTATDGCGAIVGRVHPPTKEADPWRNPPRRRRGS